MDLRELKALEIAARARITFEAGVWSVPSQSGAGHYRVTLGEDSSCTCEDFALRKLPCKHIIAARCVCERDHGGKAPEIVVDAVPRKPTYKQDWPKYNAAQMTEKDRFQELLFGLLAGIEEPAPPKTGRPRTPMKDQVFAACLKVFTGFSSRRFACDLKAAFGAGHLSKLMHSVSVCAYLESEAMTPALIALIERSALPLKAVESTFAADSTGFSTSRFVRWFDEKYGKEMSGREWVKAHAMVGTKTNVITAVVIEGQHAADCPQFKPLLDTTVANGFKPVDVVADKAYLSNENLEAVVGHGATPYIPFKSNSLPGTLGGVWEKMYGYFQFRREEFLKHYHQRSNVESTFSMVKAKFQDAVRSKTDVAMKNEVLAKILCHNIVVVHQATIELGIEPTFWPAEAKGIEPASGPDILPFRRPG
jgi:transposase